MAQERAKDYKLNKKKRELRELNIKIIELINDFFRYEREKIK